MNSSSSDDNKKKAVKFADGIFPGEGTSPSGGEELSSPPPEPRKLPKEKRYTKTKKAKLKHKKKKIKVCFCSIFYNVVLLYSQLFKIM